MKKMQDGEFFKASANDVQNLRTEVAEMMTSDRFKNKAKYANALITEIAHQISNVDPNDQIWGNDISTQKLSESGALVKDIKTKIFPDCKTKQEITNILRNVKLFEQKYFEAAVDVLIKDEAFHSVYLNQVIAEDFCKQKNLDFKTNFKLDKNHFYLADGNYYDIEPDGNCFFHAFIKKTTPINQ